MTIDGRAAVLRDLLTTTKDGDWGEGEPLEGYVAYRVIRGTDFPAARIGDVSSVPMRYLSAATAPRRTLQTNDILIETAGGSKDRPTGRTLLITERLLERLDAPATCASFARFMRVDPKQADPRYVYWYLQDLYASGQMRQHQVQHTGVARFQYTRFAETQQIPLPPNRVQEAIADVLCALEDKIEVNRRVVVLSDELWLALMAQTINGRDGAEAALPPGWTRVPLSSLARFVNGRNLTKDATGSGRMVVRIAELNAGPGGSTVYNDVDAAPNHVAVTGDLLFAWSGSLTVQRWFRSEAIVNQHIFKVIPSPGIPIWLVHGHLLRLLPSYRQVAANKATTMGHIQRRHLDELVTLPDADTRKVLHELCAPLWERALAAEQESLLLGQLRDTLLRPLISGELQVRDAEALVGEAV